MNNTNISILAGLFGLSIFKKLKGSKAMKIEDLKEEIPVRFVFKAYEDSSSSLQDIINQFFQEIDEGSRFWYRGILRKDFANSPITGVISLLHFMSSHQSIIRGKDLSRCTQLLEEEILEFENAENDDIFDITADGIFDYYDGWDESFLAFANNLSIVFSVLKDIDVRYQKYSPVIVNNRFEDHRYGVIGPNREAPNLLVFIDVKFSFVVPPKDFINAMKDIITRFSYSVVEDPNHYTWGRGMEVFIDPENKLPKRLKSIILPQTNSQLRRF